VALVLSGTTCSTATALCPITTSRARGCATKSRSMYSSLHWTEQKWTANGCSVVVLSQTDSIATSRRAETAPTASDARPTIHASHACFVVPQVSQTNWIIGISNAFLEILAEEISFGCQVAMTRNKRILSNFTASKSWDAKNSFLEENLWKACPRGCTAHICPIFVAIRGASCNGFKLLCGRVGRIGTAGF